MITNEFTRRLREGCANNASLAALPNSRAEKEYFRFCTAGLDVRSSEDFTTWLKDGRRRLFPHEAFICGLCEIGPSGLTPKQFVNIDFPIEYLAVIKNNGGFLTSPVIANWLRERKPQMFDLSFAKTYPDDWIANFEAHDLCNIASHGLVDLGGRAMSYFGFHRIPGKVGKQHADMLRLLVPHLHQAFTKVVQHSRQISPTEACTPHKLTEREREILKWISLGKSNVEIASIVGISAMTVKIHVSNVLAKLNATNRGHATAIAIHAGLLTP